MFDINKDLIDRWNHCLHQDTQAANLPIFEPFLFEFFQKAKENNNLMFTHSDFQACVKKAEAVFVCVNTPPLQDEAREHLGQGTDMRAFNSVVRAVAEAAAGIMEAKDVAWPKILVNKSTVPVGTALATAQIIERVLSAKTHVPVEDYFTIVSMPEFLAEG